MARELVARLDAVPQSAAKARRALSELLRECGLEGHAQEFAVLAASELLTNAICHGHGPIELRAEVNDHIIRVQVSDLGAPLRANANDPDPWSTTGRRLAIVEAVSRDWGVEWHGGAGKTVWAE